VFHIDLSPHRYYLCIRKLAWPAFIPRHSQNNPWNNLPVIRLRVVMFRSEALRGAPIQFRGSIHGETLDNMVSAARSADFEQLALPLLPSLYNHAFWLARNHAEAEDLVQETLAKAFRAFDSFQADTNFKGWIFRILRNTFLTSRSGIAASRTIFLEDHPAALDTTDSGPTPEDNLIRLDNQAVLQRALEKLEPPLREALLLCDVEEVKYRDIALILDIPIGTVMSRISRARRALRQLLQPQLGESQ
jgi:RNA polymerase sigma-70 factor (ECF subfamily)